MGYDLHIVRTKDWSDAEKKPIVKSDVDALIASDHELGWSLKDYIDVADPSAKKVIRITTRYMAIEWKGVSTFWWEGTAINCKNPTPVIIAKMVRIARVLSAFVVGDDGETYDVKKGFFGGEKVVSTTEDGKTAVL